MIYQRNTRDLSLFDVRKKDYMLLLCTETYEDRLHSVEEQVNNGFGSTYMGAFSGQFNDMAEVIKFNYLIEKKNEVGICLNTSLVIAPKKFFKNINDNNYDYEMDTYINDIIISNEKYIQSEEIYIVLMNDQINTYNNLDLEESLENLKRKFDKYSFIYTKKISFEY